MNPIVSLGFLYGYDINAYGQEHRAPMQETPKVKKISYAKAAYMFGELSYIATGHSTLEPLLNEDQVAPTTALEKQQTNCAVLMQERLTKALELYAKNTTDLKETMPRDKQERVQEILDAYKDQKIEVRKPTWLSRHLGIIKMGLDHPLEDHAVYTMRADELVRSDADAARQKSPAVA